MIGLIGSGTLLPYRRLIAVASKAEREVSILDAPIEILADSDRARDFRPKNRASLVLLNQRLRA